jgi:hypothetical protein
MVWFCFFFGQHTGSTDVKKPYLTEAPYLGKCKPKCLLSVVLDVVANTLWLFLYIYVVAPLLVVLLKQNYRLDDLGNRTTHYYQAESCGIAAGVFVTALHNANLSTLTSTPMGAEREIRKILGRPDHEKVSRTANIIFTSLICVVTCTKSGVLVVARRVAGKGRHRTAQRQRNTASAPGRILPCH